MTVKNSQQQSSRTGLQKFIHSLSVKLKLVLCVFFSNHQLWLVFQYKPKKKDTWAFEIQGIFSNEQKAIKVCKDRNYSIMPLELDKALPHKTGNSTNYYPIEN